MCSNMNYKQFRIDSMAEGNLPTSSMTATNTSFQISRNCSTSVWKQTRQYWAYTAITTERLIWFFFCHRKSMTRHKELFSTIIDRRIMKLATTWITGIQKPLPLVRGTLWTMKGNIDHTRSLKDIEANH